MLLFHASVWMQENAPIEPWFDPETFGSYFGAIAGSAGGILIGGLGALVGVYAPKGKGKNFILPVTFGVLIVCLASLVIGIVAKMQSQPYAIYFGFLLIGTVGSGLSFMLLQMSRKAYQQAELRRIEAESIRHS